MRQLKASQYAGIEPAFCPSSELQPLKRQPNANTVSKLLIRFVCFACFIPFALPAGAQTPLGNSNKLAERLDDYLRPYLEVKDFSGVVLIAQGDTILAEKAYGMADFEAGVPNRIGTAFRIASLSKTFTAAAIAILIERGKVKLDDPLSRYIPDFPNGVKINVKQLLLHQSGVGQLDAPELLRNCSSTADLVERLKGVPPLFAPGTGGGYSNEGYLLLAAVIEKASGLTYESFLRENIFTPLGMSHTGTMCTKWPVAQHANGYVSGLGSRAARLPFNQAGWNGPGSIYSTAGDLYLWLKAVAENRLFHFDLNPWPYGWGKRNFSGRTFADQTGELRGFTSHMAVYPQEKLFFVFLSNVESGLFNRLEKDFEALMFGGTTSTPPTALEIPVAPWELQAYSGAYTTPSISAPMHLVVKDNHLWMGWGEDPFLRPLIRIGKDEFFFRAEYASVQFERNGSGKIERVNWRWGESTPLTLTRKEPSSSRPHTLNSDTQSAIGETHERIPRYHSDRFNDLPRFCNHGKYSS